MSLSNGVADSYSILFDVSCLENSSESNIIYDHIRSEVGSVPGLKFQEFLVSKSEMQISDFSNLPGCINRVLEVDTASSQVQVRLAPTTAEWGDVNSDPGRGIQTHLDALSAEDAHEIVYEDLDYENNKVVVAVIDTGVHHDHRDLRNRMFRRNGQIVGYDFYNNDSNADDDQSHGTHVAGLIAAEGHNGVGVRGGSPTNVLIMPIKIFGQEGSLPVQRLGILANAIRYAADNGADIINMSLGIGTTEPQAFESGPGAIIRDALEYAVGQGALILVAAGNDSQKLDGNFMSYPAKFGLEMNGVVTVGAFDVFDQTISSFSNYSAEYVELQAPGSDRSKVQQGLVSTDLNQSYSYKAGTSMATPLISGMAALIKLFLNKFGASLSPSEMESLMKSTALKYQSLQGVAQYGRVINYKRTIEELVKIYDNGIEDHPMSQSVTLGSRIRLAVKMFAFSSDQSFQWYFNGAPIPGATDLDLVLSNIQEEDLGEYHVEVTLGSGEVVRSLSSFVEKEVQKVRRSGCD
jgi:subtilisin family serine protease